MRHTYIGFIGLGLIGGSIAGAIKKTYPDTKIIALASGERTLAAAHKDGLIDNASFLPLETFADCDIIFLCSPVGINVSYLERLADIVPADCILTDVGSVKGDISAAASALGLDDRFIGGHPMTGSEAVGYENASDSLLENAYYILTARPTFSRERLQEFRDFIASLGAIPLLMTPDKHDFATAAISHLPHVIAASLVNLVKKQDASDGTLKTIAAGGFRDITRIASSSPVMWQHICLTNREEILHLLRLYEGELASFRDVITGGNADEILALFTSAKDYRDNLPLKDSGALPCAFEFYCDLADEAGGIATVATILASRGLSIKNIGIVHNREFEQGVLRIEMYDQPSLETAVTLLQEQTYRIYH